MQVCVKLNNYIWEIILYLQANTYWLKAKNINGLILLALLLNNKY